MGKLSMAGILGSVLLLLDGCSGVLETHGPGASADQDAQVPSGSDGGDRDAGLLEGGLDGSLPPPGVEGSVFIAFGHVGRTVLSCDNGRTWFADQSLDDAARCWQEGGPECDHQSHSGVDITVAEGQVFRTLGWGAPGGIDRSPDGIRWTRISEDSSWSALVHGRGRLIGFGGWGSTVSMDLGDSFEDLDIPLQATSRRALFFSYGSGRFIVYGDTHVALSNDGESWAIHRGVLAQDINCAGHFSYGDGVLLLAGDQGICRSADGGESWTVSYQGDVHSPMWTGSQFEAWANGMKLTSSDGTDWEETPLVPAGIRIRRAERNDAGHYVGVEQGWDNYYEAQRFHYSADGVRWTEASSYRGGHPINKIVSATLPSCRAR